MSNGFVEEVIVQIANDTDTITPLRNLLHTPEGDFDYLNPNRPNRPNRPVKLNKLSEEFVEGTATPSAQILKKVANKVARLASPATMSFETVSERNRNSGDINTDDTDFSIGKNQLSITGQYNTYECSVSSLDRKLKNMNKLSKKYKQQSNFKQTGSKKHNKHVARSKYYDRHKSITTMNEDTPLSSNGSLINNVETSSLTLDVNKLINEHITEIRLLIIGHTRAAKSFEKREKIIGYPVTILSSFVSSTIMMGITSDPKNDQSILRIISLVMSVTSFFLSISRDYLNYARRRQSHDLSSKLYTTLLRSVEARLIDGTIRALTNEDRCDIFKDIVDQISIIEQYESPVPNRIDKYVRIDINTIDDISI